MNVPEPAPLPNASTPIWDLVCADMRERDHVGRAKYGTPLQAHNGRDALVDLYQELLDACVYVRQEIAERADAAAAERTRIVEQLRAYADTCSGVERSYLLEASDHVESDCFPERSCDRSGPFG